MTEVYLTLTLFLLLNVGGGLWRIVRGPTPADRMLAAQMFGTIGVAILVLLSMALQEEVILDVALVYGLLAVVAAVAFVRSVWTPPERHDGGSDAS